MGRTAERTGESDGWVTVSKTGINEMSEALNNCTGNPCGSWCERCKYRGCGGCIAQLHKGAMRFLIYLAMFFVNTKEKENKPANGAS